MMAPGGLIRQPYWLTEPLIKGKNNLPPEGGILVIGSGFSGVSVAYWLQTLGLQNVVLIDDQPEKAASFRNCGHILHGTVESIAALAAIHGKVKAKDIWKHSILLCEELQQTVQRHQLDCDYQKNGYLVIAIDETEAKEINDSIALLIELGFSSEFIDTNTLQNWGIKNAYGARFEAGSAHGHPVKFRNGLLKHCLNQGLPYHSGCPVSQLEEKSGLVEVKICDKVLRYDAVVIATNAYAPQFSDFFSQHRLIEPFRGQMLASKPLKHPGHLSFPHSFDHGYEYGLISPDNRLLIGGWRHHTPDKEVGSYDLNPNPSIATGLKQFVENHYILQEELQWEFEWTGIMAASQSGLPYVGATSSPLIFTCAGYTGHGFSWAHGCAKILAQMMMGHPVSDLAKYLRPYL